MNRIILASKSPRRTELLKLITDAFDVIPSSFNESAVKETEPAALVRTLSFGKAKAVFDTLPSKEALVIGCDTVVTIDGNILGKPSDAEEARRFLRLLSGRVHSVITGVCLMEEQGTAQFECETKVEFFSLDEDEIERYVLSGEPFDKAGGYGIQGKASLFVKSITGDYSNVVGLPVAPLFRLLKKRLPLY